MSTQAIPPQAPDALSPRLPEQLRILIDELGNQDSMELGQLIKVLDSRSYLLLMILLALPFVTPVPIPLISLPFGIAITYIAGRMMVGLSPKLPQRLRQVQVPAQKMAVVLRACLRVFEWIEKRVRPRYLFLTRAPGAMQFHAAWIFLAACVLSLPLPIPLVNSFPAWWIILLAIGMLERDGLVLIVGYMVYALGIAYFALWAFMGAQVIQWIKNWLA